MLTALTAVLFDMDGTITDTEAHYVHAFDRLAAAAEVRLTKAHHQAVVGASFESMAETAERAGIAGTRREIIAAIEAAVLDGIRGSEPVWQPGALELVAQLRAAGVATALVTMSYRSLADEVVASIPFEAFDVIVTGDEVERGKPHPDAYLRAAERLGVDIADCVVIEDSATGVAAGLAAGARVIAVPFYLPLPESDDYTLWPDGLARRGVNDVVHGVR